jgi:hypothetical protein
MLCAIKNRLESPDNDHFIKGVIALIEQLPVGLNIIENDRIIFANSVFREQTGLTIEELSALSPEDFLDMIRVEEPSEYNRIRLQSIMNNINESVKLSGKIVHVNGVKQPVQFIFSPLKHSGFPNILLVITFSVCKEYHSLNPSKHPETRESVFNTDFGAKSSPGFSTLLSKIAHEINNPNQFIVLNTPVLAEIWKNVTPILDSYAETNGDFMIGNFFYSTIKNRYFKACENIMAGAMRIKGIIEKSKEELLLFPPQLINRVNINSVVASAIGQQWELVEASTQSFRLHLENHLPHLHIDFDGLKGVIEYLIKRACQRINDRQKELQITTSRDNENVHIVIFAKSGEDIDQNANISLFSKWPKDFPPNDGNLFSMNRILNDMGAKLKIHTAPPRSFSAGIVLPLSLEKT